MLIVHHLNDSRSQRILWVLEELGIPYEIKKYQRTETMQAPQELLDINPIGKSPVISDGDIILAESGAIIEYLIEKYGNGKWKPTTDSGYIDNLYYTHTAEGSLMPLLVQKLMLQVIPQKAPYIISYLLRYIFGTVDASFLQPDVDRFIKLIEGHLSKVEYFAGGTEPTSADFAMSFPLEALVLEKMAGPHITKYVLKFQSRPGYQRALEKGGDYSYVAKL